MLLPHLQTWLLEWCVDLNSLIKGGPNDLSNIMGSFASNLGPSTDPLKKGMLYFHHYTKPSRPSQV